MIQKVSFENTNSSHPLTAVLLRPPLTSHPVPPPPPRVDPRPSPGWLRAAGCPRVPHRSAGRPAQTLQRSDAQRRYHKQAETTIKAETCDFQSDMFDTES